MKSIKMARPSSASQIESGGRFLKPEEEQVVVIAVFLLTQLFNYTAGQLEYPQRDRTWENVRNTPQLTRRGARANQE